MPARISKLGGYLLAAAALLSGPSAMAENAETSASLTGFTWKLIDLNPADGIAPSVTFTQTAVAHWTQHPADPTHFDMKEDYGSTELNTAVGAARTQIDPTNAYAWAQSSAGQPFAAYNISILLFELTPFTGIEFSALGNVSSTHIGSTATIGHVGLEGYLTNADGLPLSTFASVLTSAASATGVGSQQLTGMLKSGEEAAMGSLRADTIAVVNLMPIPEPETYAMLLAGLGLLGWRARRG